jgi:hypothetical protein
MVPGWPWPLRAAGSPRRSQPRRRQTGGGTRCALHEGPCVWVAAPAVPGHKVRRERARRQGEDLLRPPRAAAAVSWAGHGRAGEGPGQGAWLPHRRPGAVVFAPGRPTAPCPGHGGPVKIRKPSTVRAGSHREPGRNAAAGRWAAGGIFAGRWPRLAGKGGASGVAAPGAGLSALRRSRQGFQDPLAAPLPHAHIPARTELLLGQSILEVPAGPSP